MARSTAASAKSMVTSIDHGSMGDRPKSGHFTCSRERTDHVLPTPVKLPVDGGGVPT
jgi:hypothetical protein